MPRTFRRLRLGAALGCALFAFGLMTPAAPAQQRVGVNSAVNPNASGTPPGALPRRLVLGQDVVFNERIQTEAQGQTQILFVDESTLSVGPNANMVIDQFVYDPNRGTGKLVASLGRGVFRFVGGKLSKEDNGVTMRTPTATIGIRGGVMLVDQSPSGKLDVIFVFGKGVTITGADGTSQTIYRPGFEVTVSGPGAAPSSPAPAPPGRTAALLAQIDGRPGGNGGAPVAPTEVTVARSGVASVISASINANIQANAPSQQAAAQTSSTTRTVLQTVPPTTLQIAANPQGSLVGNPAVAFSPPLPQPAPVAPVAGPSTPVVPVVGPPTPPFVPPAPPINPPTPPAPPTPPTPPSGPTVNIPNLAGGFADTDHAGTSFGFATPPSGPTVFGPVTAYGGGMVVNGVFTGGGYQFPVKTGVTAVTPQDMTTSPLGAVAGAVYLAPDQSYFFAYLTPVGDPAQREVIYGGTPVRPAFYAATSTTPTYLSFQVVPDAALNSAIPFIRQATGGSLGSPSVTPLVFATPPGATFSTVNATTKALQASFAVNGAGSGQSSVLVVLVGNVFGSPPSLQGVLHGSYLANAAGQPTRINSYYQTPVDGAGNSFYGKTSISGFTLTPGAGAPNAVEVNTANQTTAANYQFAQPAIPTAVPAAASGSQTNRALSGFFGGIMTKEPVGGSGRPLAYAVAGATSITTEATDPTTGAPILQVAATLSGGDPLTPRASGIPRANGMVLQFGSTAVGGTNARQAFISDNYFAALESPNTNSTVAGVPVSFSASYPNTNPNLYLLTQTAAPPPASLLPSGLCSSCQYLQWGYWGGEIDSTNPASGAMRVDVGHINTWVAGTPTALSDIANLKAMNMTGTYNGNLLGTVVNGGAQYLASGGLQATYHFGTQTGSFAVNNYDRSISFKTPEGPAPLTGSNYSFIFNRSGIRGAVNGGFFGPNAAETGGNFAFTAGPSYTTSGIFAAKGTISGPR